MKYKKNAIVLIYVLFLVTISVIFASILLNNNSYLFNINSFFEINSKLYSNIDSDTLISININREVNKNGWWFIDNMSCPWWANVSMSGSFNTALIWTTLINSGSIYCEWTYLSKSLKLYFNTWSSDFDVADYDWYIVSL